MLLKGVASGCASRCAERQDGLGLYLHRVRTVNNGAVTDITYHPIFGKPLTILENGDRIWRILISSPGAISLNFIFDDFYMPKGGSLYL